MLTRDATYLWSRLNGIICIYKPPLITSRSVRRTLLAKLSKDLNELDCRPPRPFVDITGETNKELHVEVRPSYADHTLAVGPRYLKEEFKAHFVHSLSSLTSGVCVVGINGGTKKAYYIRNCNPASTFRVTGQLGILTSDQTWTGNTVYRCNCNHIQKYNLDKAVSVIESTQLKSKFALMGVHRQSQSAYEMLSEGLFRPVENKYPLIYSMKCVDLNLPYFTLEIVATNESERHLLNIVTEVGSRLKNAAITTSIQCIRCAYFTLEDALLKKHWTLQNVIDNMARCEKILANNKEFGQFLKLEQEKEERLLVEDVNAIEEEEEEEEVKG